MVFQKIFKCILRYDILINIYIYNYIYTWLCDVTFAYIEPLWSGFSVLLQQAGKYGLKNEWSADVKLCSGNSPCFIVGSCFLVIRGIYL